MELTLSKKYLPIGAKREICEIIKLNALTEENGMKFIDYINLQVFTDISLLQFYFEQNLDDLDMDQFYADGVIDYMRSLIPSSEIEFIRNNVKNMLHQDIEVYNSLAGVLNRNLENLISKIPTEDAIKSLVTELPNIIKNTNPDTLKFLAQAIGWNNGAQPNREQRRKSAKSDKISKAKSTEKVTPISE